MNKQELIKIRPYKEEDKNFIYASWLRGLYYGESWFSLIDKEAFMKHYHKVIGFLIGKPVIEIRIACLKEDEDTILGYAVCEPKKLHWVFVKKPWRKIGIATLLLDKDISTVTHLTRLGLSIIRAKKVDFNPFDI